MAVPSIYTIIKYFLLTDSFVTVLFILLLGIRIRYNLLVFQYNLDTETPEKAGNLLRWLLIIE